MYTMVALNKDVNFCQKIQIYQGLLWLYRLKVCFICKNIYTEPSAVIQTSLLPSMILHFLDSCVNNDTCIHGY